VKAINAAGGINGHPIKVITCDTKSNPNGAVACGRSAASDGAVAAIAPTTNYDTNLIPVLAHENIPALGTVALATLSAQNSFPFAPAAITLVPGEPALAASLGAKKITMVVVQAPDTSSVTGLAGIGLAPYHMQLAGITQIPSGAPDMSPYVAAATAHGADAVCVVLEQTDGVNFIKAARAAGYNGIIVSDAIDMLRDLQTGFGSTVQGVYAIDEFLPASDTSNPVVAKMVSEIKAVDPKLIIDSTVEDAWASTYLFAQVAKTLPAVTAPAVLAAMPSVTNFDPGIAKPVNFSKPITAIPGLHAYNPYVLFDRVSNGQLVPTTGQFTNLFP
jgi:ABC-type branched-subunit amino acid transport system substrate-binding protein